MPLPNRPPSVFDGICGASVITLPRGDLITLSMEWPYGYDTPIHRGEHVSLHVWVVEVSERGSWVLAQYGTEPPSLWP
jgi:hypothetical protein